MKKRVNTSEIVSELQGSVFFPSKPQAPIQQEQPLVKNEVKSSPPVRDVPPVLPELSVPQYHSSPVPRTTVPPRRKIKQRHPFDIYQDQLDTLRQISAEERMQ